MATMSVVRWVVVDSISPDGHRGERDPVQRSGAPSAPALVSSGTASTALAGTVSAQAATSRTSKA